MEGVNFLMTSLSKYGRRMRIGAKGPGHLVQQCSRLEFTNCGLCHRIITKCQLHEKIFPQYAELINFSVSNIGEHCTNEL